MVERQGDTSQEADDLREGAAGILMNHGERCTSRDNCKCEEIAARLNAKADAIEHRKPD